MARYGRRMTASRRRPRACSPYIAQAFGDRLAEVRGAMQALAASLPPEGLNRTKLNTVDQISTQSHRLAAVVISMPSINARAFPGTGTGVVPAFTWIEGSYTELAPGAHQRQRFCE